MSFIFRKYCWKTLGSEFWRPLGKGLLFEKIIKVWNKNSYYILKFAFFNDKRVSENQYMLSAIKNSLIFLDAIRS